MRSRIALTILALVVLVIVIALMRFNLAALQEPGRFEMRVANLAKRYVIRPRKPPWNSSASPRYKSER